MRDVGAMRKPAMRKTRLREVDPVTLCSIMTTNPVIVVDVALKIILLLLVLGLCGFLSLIGWNIWHEGRATRVRKRP